MGLHNVRMTDPSDHLPNDLRFYLWPYFLKLSPSYAEVHRLYTANPRAPRRPRIPASLKAVAEVYEIVGDAYSERVHDWTRERWIEIFGLHLASEQLKMLCVLRKGTYGKFWRASWLKRKCTYTSCSRPLRCSSGSTFASATCRRH